MRLLAGSQAVLLLSGEGMQVHNLVAGRISLALAVALCALCLEASAVNSSAMTPDTIQLKSGKVLRGMIVKQTNSGVTIQLPYGEETVKNEDIVRIRNVDDHEMWFTRVLTPGTLPPWRIIANDLRNQDDIKTFQQIPATVIDNGVFKNVPYISFRANDYYELDIYGDPDDPAGIELGVYGPMRSAEATHKVLRQFLGSYLTTLDEIRALYSMNPKGDLKRVGSITLEITPPNAPDAYGAWWISFYDEKKLDKIRLSDAEYKKLTMPVEDVVDQKGKAKIFEWQARDVNRSARAKKEGKTGRLFFDGFYRDKDGNFHIFEPGDKNPDAPTKN
jgi:hypothetical protein